MEVRRTLPVKLDVADSDRDALLATIDQYKHCANKTSDHCWHENDHKKTAKYAVKDELYHDLKAEHDLTANLVQQAIFQAVKWRPTPPCRQNGSPPTSPSPAVGS
ncbi:MAG: transposase [Halobacteriales archaeon]